MLIVMIPTMTCHQSSQNDLTKTQGKLAPLYTSLSDFSPKCNLFMISRCYSSEALIMDELAGNPLAYPGLRECLACLDLHNEFHLHAYSENPVVILVVPE